MSSCACVSSGSAMSRLGIGSFLKVVRSQESVLGGCAPCPQAVQDSADFAGFREQFGSGRNRQVSEVASDLELCLDFQQRPAGMAYELVEFSPRVSSMSLTDVARHRG